MEATRTLRLGVAPLETAKAQARWVLERAAECARDEPRPGEVPQPRGEDIALVEVVETRPAVAQGGELFLDAETLGATHDEELQRALERGLVDLALHHLGDRPGAWRVGQLAALLERRRPFDALLGPWSLADLPAGARVAVASQRCRALLLGARPDVHAVH